MRLIVIAVISMAVTPACRDRTSGQRIQLSGPEFARCIAVLERASTTTFTDIAEACQPACPSGLSRYAKEIAEIPIAEDELWHALAGCLKTCDSLGIHSKSEPSGQRLPRAIGDCGSDYFNIEKRHSNLVSDSTVVLARIQSWLRRARPLLNNELRVRLGHALDSRHFAVPPPTHIDGVYSLPSSASGRRYQSSLYVVLSKSGKRYIASSPVVLMRGEMLTFRPVPGGMPPGLELPESGAKQIFDDLRVQWGEHHGGKDDPPIVYLADATTPATTLATTAHALGHRTFHLAVAGVSTREHLVALEVHSEPFPTNLRLRGATLVVEGDASESLVDRIRSTSVAASDSTPLTLEIAPASTIHDLSRALDIIATAGARSVILLNRTPSAKPPGGPG